VTINPRAAATDLRQLEGVQGVTHRKDGDWTVFTIEASPDIDPREALFRHAVEKKWRVREISRPAVSLERVFAEVTGGEEH
jgi:ABC-type uncharacterized transport system ATPase subunit